MSARGLFYLLGFNDDGTVVDSRHVVFRRIRQSSTANGASLQRACERMQYDAKGVVEISVRPNGYVARGKGGTLTQIRAPTPAHPRQVLTLRFLDNAKI